MCITNEEMNKNIIFIWCIKFKQIGIKYNYGECVLIGFGTFQTNEVQLDALQTDLGMCLN